MKRARTSIAPGAVKEDWVEWILLSIKRDIQHVNHATNLDPVPILMSNVLPLKRLETCLVITLKSDKEVGLLLTRMPCSPRCLYSKM